MSILGELGHPELLDHIKTYQPGEFLFKQGDLANTMVLVAAGHVCLFAEKNGKSRYVSMVHTGQVLGEKLLTSGEKYPRSLTAQAASLTTVLELGHDDLRELADNSPEILKELLITVVQVLCQRFDNSTELVKMLRSTDPSRRLALLIVYLANTMGSPVEGGTQILLTMDTIDHYLEISKSVVATVLSELEAKGLIEKVTSANYRIADIENLRLFAERKSASATPPSLFLAEDKSNKKVL